MKRSKSSDHNVKSQVMEPLTKQSEEAIDSAEALQYFYKKVSLCDKSPAIGKSAYEKSQEKTFIKSQKKDAGEIM